MYTVEFFFDTVINKSTVFSHCIWKKKFKLHGWKLYEWEAPFFLWIGGVLNITEWSIVVCNPLYCTAEWFFASYSLHFKQINVKYNANESASGVRVFMAKVLLLLWNAWIYRRNIDSYYTVIECVLLGWMCNIGSHRNLLNTYMKFHIYFLWRFLFLSLFRDKYVALIVYYYYLLN